MRDPLARALLAAVLLIAVGAAPAQSRSETQRRLEQVRRELGQVAAERRRIEGQRGDATRQLRDADEQVGQSTRALRETEARLQREQAALADLQRRRDALQRTLGARRAELAALLRAAYTVGGDAPLKLMLAQDRVADANRMLAYHRYLQRERSRRIEALRAELAGLQQVEREISRTRRELDAARARQRDQIARLERDRRARADAVARLEQRYRDRAARERALGRDAKGLEQVLTQLRAAAARAAAQRMAAARKAAAGGSAKTVAGRRGTGSAPGQPRPRAPVIANATPVQVGGLGWPLSGTLLAGYGGTLPDGRGSSGLLIAAPTGTPVRAVANGKVVFAEWMSGYGLICIVDHGNGYMSLYANNDGLLRDAGADVKRGDPVASVGNSGGQGRPALYFELRRNGQPVNPATWLQKR